MIKFSDLNASQIAAINAAAAIDGPLLLTPAVESRMSAQGQKFWALVPERPMQVGCVACRWQRIVDIEAIAPDDEDGEEGCSAVTIVTNDDGIPLAYDIFGPLAFVTIRSGELVAISARFPCYTDAELDW